MKFSSLTCVNVAITRSGGLLVRRLTEGDEEVLSSGSRVKLVAARKAVGKTQEQLARAVGVSRETVNKWESGMWAPSLYYRPMLAKALERPLKDLEELINPEHSVDELDRLSAIGPNIEEACDWLDKHAEWKHGTARQKVVARLGGSELSKARIRDVERGSVARSKIVELLSRYYRNRAGWYQAEYENTKVQLAVISQADWIDLNFPLTYKTDLLALSSAKLDDSMMLDAVGANQAARRLVEAASLNVTIVNSPLYRLKEFKVSRSGIVGSLGVIPFVQYALTTDLLETELIDGLIGSNSSSTGVLPVRDRYLPTTASIFDVSQRSCCGGILALCAIARPADWQRGPADYVLLTQERGRRVLNGAGRISVIPRGFHQPLTDFRADAPIRATLCRELEEELFHRADVDNTISEGRIADPMHPNRLSDPMRWLLKEPGRIRFECTGFGFNLINGNYEFACLAVIDDPEFWKRYGDRIEANWESDGLRQYSSRDRGGIRDLLQDEAWSSEGLFALIQGLRRLSELNDDRLDLPEIDAWLLD